MDRYNSQSLVELLRQHIDSNGLYSPLNSHWQHIDNITYVATSNSNQSLTTLSRLIKHFHVIQMDMPNESELVSIFTKLVNRHFIGDSGESQLETKDSNESSGRVSTGKSSTITTTTTTDPSTTTIGLKEKLSTQALKRLEYLRSIIERIVQGTVELNDRMRNIYQINDQRTHYVFSMKQLTQLFRNMCTSLTPDCAIDDILYLWHHECDWLYGKRLYDQIDQQRYQQLYKTIVKKYFTNMINEQQSLLTQDQQFSNLQVTESGLLIDIFFLFFF
jgi:dynein heavy chain